MALGREPKVARTRGRALPGARVVQTEVSVRRLHGASWGMRRKEEDGVREMTGQILVDIIRAFLGVKQELSEDFEHSNFVI